MLLTCHFPPVSSVTPEKSRAGGGVLSRTCWRLFRSGLLGPLQRTACTARPVVAFLALIAAVFVTTSNAQAQTTLTQGDAVILSFNQSTTSFKWAPLVDLAAGTVIGITDYGIPGDASPSQTYPQTSVILDGAFTFTPTSAVSKGTIFTVTITANTSTVTMTRDSDGASFSAQTSVISGWTGTSALFTIAGDSLIIYQGDISSSPSFIYCCGFTSSTVSYTSNGFLTTGSSNNGANCTRLPPGLTVGSTAVGFAFSTPEDYRGVYTGTATTSDRNTWLSRITTAGSWTLATGTSPTPSFGTTLPFASANPTVTSLATTSGPSAGGTSVVITGTGFTGASAVVFGSTSATGFTVNSATQITATAPAGSAGTVDITVTTTGGTSATGAGDQFTYVAAPTVTSLATTSGPSAGGTSVVITGTGFTGASAVVFGSTSATGFTVNSATQITATAPAGSAGTVDITVTTTGGTSATGAGDQFTYVAAPTVTSLATTSGPSAGGTSVVITGTGFTGASAVVFGSTSATGFTVNSATQITATAPAGSAGTVDVTVTTPGGTSATSAADQFTYVAPPTITSISSTKGNGSYNATVLVPITVTFSAAVTVTGVPTLALNSGGSASFASGSGTATLTFNYTVGATDNATLLDCSSTTALALAGGTINATTGGTAATLTLPTPGGANSLGANKAIVIDTTPPTIVSINRLTPTGQTTASNIVIFRVTYSEPVTVPGASNFSVVAVNGSNIVGTVTSVTGSGNTRDVTVTITSGTGEFRLRGVN